MASAPAPAQAPAQTPSVPGQGGDNQTPQVDVNQTPGQPDPSRPTPADPSQGQLEAQAQKALMAELFGVEDAEVVDKRAPHLDGVDARPRRIRPIPPRQAKDEGTALERIQTRERAARGEPSPAKPLTGEEDALGRDPSVAGNDPAEPDSGEVVTVEVNKRRYQVPKAVRDNVAALQGQFKSWHKRTTDAVQLVNQHSAARQQERDARVRAETELAHIKAAIAAGQVPLIAQPGQPAPGTQPPRPGQAPVNGEGDTRKAFIDHFNWKQFSEEFARNPVHAIGWLSAELSDHQSASYTDMEARILAKIQEQLGPLSQQHAMTAELSESASALDNYASLKDRSGSHVYPELQSEDPQTLRVIVKLWQDLGPDMAKTPRGFHMAMLMYRDLVMRGVVPATRSSHPPHNPVNGHQSPPYNPSAPPAAAAHLATAYDIAREAGAVLPGGNNLPGSVGSDPRVLSEGEQILEGIRRVGRSRTGGPSDLRSDWSLG